MAYSRRYRRRRKSREYNAPGRRQLTSLFGGIDHDVEKIFLNLRSQDRELLLKAYGHKYGENAEKYARKTFRKWKSGATKMSGLSATRLLDLIPPRLSEEERYELIRKLRKHYLTRERVIRNVNTPATSWRQHVEPAVQELINVSRDLQLPEELLKKAEWLADGDTQAVERILQSIEEEEAKERTTYLEAEFKRIEIWVENVKNAKSVSHLITLPQGDIHVKIQKKKPTWYESIFGEGGTTMSGDSHELVPREKLQEALQILQSRGSLLNLTLDELSEDQRKDLQKQIADEQIRLDVSRHEAEQRFHNSTRDMAGTIQAVRSLEDSSKSDFVVDAKFQTASGQTNITVKKNNNTVIIVVAIVVGIVILLLLNN
jgi:hypothetical protein